MDDQITQTNDGKFSIKDAQGNVKTFATRQEAEAALAQQKQPGVTGTQNWSGGHPGGQGGAPR